MKIFASEEEICAIFLGEQQEDAIQRYIKRCKHSLMITKGTSSLLALALDALTEYVLGNLKTFSLPLKFLSGTPFQHRVWRALETIPYGKCVSYQWIAEKIDNPRAMRAVGNAVGSNPLPILIPCHRVIRKNGTLGGFSSGLAIKKALLKIEGCYKTPKETT